MIYYADTSQNVQNELHQLAQHLHLPLPSLFTRIICMFIACIYSNYAAADARNFKELQLESMLHSKPDIECEAKRKICISWRCDNQSLRTSDLLSPRTGKLSMHKQWKERHSTVWHNSFTQMPSGSSSQNLNGMFTFCLHILLNLHCWPCFPLPEDIKRAVKILNNFTGKRSRRFRIHNQNLTLSIQILSTAATFDE